MERIQRLTERLTELLSDENQDAVADILQNIERTTDVLADKAPELGEAIADTRIAVRNAGIAAERVGALADSTNRLVNEEGRPAAQDLRVAIAQVQSAAENLDAMVGDARPGVQNFSNSTLPEINRLVRDLRELSQSLNGLVQRVEQGGIGSALGPEKLPDYEPGKSR
jgi:phospholipid/cholesterol/gamma-HCH transport system substrate-binding protein